MLKIFTESMVILEVLAMSKTFRQFDSRWGKKKYPTGASSTMSGSGCGPTACADIIVNNPQYTNITPVDTADFMIKHGYAIPNKGTAWGVGQDGIYACLKAFGLIPTRHDKMDTFFSEMSKTTRWGIILFDKGSRGGVTWTGSGHYLSVTGYKVKNGKHWLYMRDPGERKHDGWYCYEDHMKGLIKCCWTAYLSEDAKNNATTTSKTSATKANNAKIPAYKKGKIYTLQYTMNVRTAPGVTSPRLKRSKLTADAKKHAKSGTYARLKKGTRITCKDIRIVGNTIWIKSPSGWMCGYGKKKIYIK